MRADTENYFNNVIGEEDILEINHKEIFISKYVQKKYLRVNNKTPKEMFTLIKINIF